MIPEQFSTTLASKDVKLTRCLCNKVVMCVCLNKIAYGMKDHGVCHTSTKVSGAVNAATKETPFVWRTVVGIKTRIFIQHFLHKEVTTAKHKTLTLYACNTHTHAPTYTDTQTWTLIHDHQIYRVIVSLNQNTSAEIEMGRAVMKTTATPTWWSYNNCGPPSALVSLDSKLHTDSLVQ